MSEDEDDEAEFQELFGKMASSMKKKTEGVQEARKLREETPDNPDLLTVRVYLADLRAGRVSPEEHEAWEAGIIQ